MMNFENDEDDGGAAVQREDEYQWEGLYERSWEAVEEGADGLRSGLRRARAAAAATVAVGVRRGVMRCVFLVIDCSNRAGDPDAEMKPTRLAVMREKACEFVTAYFEQNPISSLGVIASSKSKAEVLTEPSCHASVHLQALKSLDVARAAGDVSLHWALQSARGYLEGCPSYISREVVLLSASLTSADPLDLHATIKELAGARIICSVFSLLAEVFVQRKLVRDTGGDFGVALGPDHLGELLTRLLPPRPLQQRGDGAPNTSLVRVGFPTRHAAGPPTLCFTGGAQPEVRAGAYFVCPQCGAHHAELPAECPVCQLRLMHATDLLKTYHHLFPLQPFAAVAGAAAASRCFGCNEPLSAGGAGGAGVACPRCRNVFCSACDELLHDTVHVCPGCQSGAEGGN